MEKSEKKMIDLVAQKSLDVNYQPDVWFSSNIFMLFGLPAQRLKANPAYWHKEAFNYQLTITRDQKYEIPYGCYARMNQLFIDTEVRTKNTNVIDVGRSFREYSQKLDYKDGKANQELLRQLVNYVTCMIKIEPRNPIPGRFTGIHSLVSRAWDIFFDVKNPEQLALFKGEIILDEGYAKYVHDHSVPLDMKMVRRFKRNPLGFDFYRFLAYRNNDLNRTLPIPEGDLFEQFGTKQQADFVTRSRLKKILKMIQMDWPVRAKFEDGYFELKPSEPAVSKKASSGREIEIRESDIKIEDEDR